MRKITYSYEQILNAVLKHKNEEHTLGEWFDIFVNASKSPKSENHLFTSLEEFVKQLDFDSRISNAALYELYVIWQGENHLPKPQFEKQIVKAFKLYRPELKPWKTRNVRGWEFNDGNS